MRPHALKSTPLGMFDSEVIDRNTNVERDNGVRATYGSHKCERGLGSKQTCGLGNMVYRLLSV